MRRDHLVISGAMLGVGLLAWTVWGNPESASRTHTAYSMHADSNLKLVSEQSPYMRTER